MRTIGQSKKICKSKEQTLEVVEMGIKYSILQELPGLYMFPERKWGEGRNTLLPKKGMLFKI